MIILCIVSKLLICSYNMSYFSCAGLEQPLPNIDIGSHMIITCILSNMDLELEARGSKRRQSSLLSYTSKRQKEGTQVDDSSVSQGKS